MEPLTGFDLECVTVGRWYDTRVGCFKTGRFGRGLRCALRRCRQLRYLYARHVGFTLMLSSFYQSLGRGVKRTGDIL